MRITEIEINNYRAFYGKHTIDLGETGKNLMVYGENGSGKSSLYTALRDFFKSSIDKISIEENIFIPELEKNTASIALKISESDENTTSQFILTKEKGRVQGKNIDIIRNANKIKGFFDYRSLLRTHLTHVEEVNLFDILIQEILYNAHNRFSKKIIGEEWEEIYSRTNDLKQTIRIVKETKALIKQFNSGLIQLLADIESDTNSFLAEFDLNIRIKLVCTGVKYFRRREFTNTSIGLQIDFLNKSIPRHQFFLNEARLSALAISLYLASVRVNPTGETLKVLVLDDLLIGLDMSNRLPLLDIILKYFVDVEENQRFQVIMTTYDKVWFELVKNRFGDSDWNYIEIYSKKLQNEDFEVPIIKNTETYIDKAKYYLSEKDYKASAIYIRTEFERLIKKICISKKLCVPYYFNPKDYDTNDFWEAIAKQTNIDSGLVNEIAMYRGLVMNPFSHYNLEKPEFERELKDTILILEKLKAINPNNLKKSNCDDLKNEVEILKAKLVEKEETIRSLGKARKTNNQK